MSVKPIDIQTNIAHIHEVAKGEQGRSAAVVEAQHLLEKKTGEKSKLVDTRVDENKKSEKTIIMREEEHRKRGRDHGKRNKEEDWEIDKKKMDEIKEDKIGNVIDVKR